MKTTNNASILKSKGLLYTKVEDIMKSTKIFSANESELANRVIKYGSDEEQFIKWNERIIGFEIFWRARYMGDLVKTLSRRMVWQRRYCSKYLSYLHKFNVIHRDLKPGNVLRGKITDFGLSVIKTTAVTSVKGHNPLI